MGGAQSPSKFQTPFFVVEAYYSIDSSSPLLKQAFQSETEVNASKIVAILAMTIGMNNWDDEPNAMKTMLEKLTKENEEKEAHIKLQEEKIARLNKKSWKQPTGSLPNSSKGRRRKRCLSKVKLTMRRCTQKEGRQAQEW